MALQGEQKWRKEDLISFPEWRAALARVTSGVERSAHEKAIFGFLRFCRVSGSPASIGVAKLYIEKAEEQAQKRDEGLRRALRWFVKTGRTQVVPARARAREEQAPVASKDLGGVDWEQALIAAVRRKGFLWRTEQTYRSWAGRFAEFMQPRSPYMAVGDDVAAFLSKLVVEKRASPSSQKQALNALVFFLQEGLRRELGQLDFKRAWPRQKVPTVLSRAECQQLFTQLNGTTRLMAELAYGAGLRLMELLRLRVHHLDLERGQLQVYGAGRV